jgi:hypothetical protein
MLHRLLTTEPIILPRFVDYISRGVTLTSTSFSEKDMVYYRHVMLEHLIKGKL